MTITNRELFYRDPTGTKIPNDGVVQVVRPETTEQWDVLQWELKSFVCDGEYAREQQASEADRALHHLPPNWVDWRHGASPRPSG